MKLKRYECQSRAVDACKSVRNLNNRSISGENKTSLSFICSTLCLTRGGSFLFISVSELRRLRFLPIIIPNVFISSSESDLLALRAGLKPVAQGLSAVTVGRCDFEIPACGFKLFGSAICEVISLLTSCLCTKYTSVMDVAVIYFPTAVLEPCKL